jgi:hypothetical protein
MQGCRRKPKGEGERVRSDETYEHSDVANYLEAGRFLDFLLRDRRHAVFCDWGGLGVRHDDGLGWTGKFLRWMDGGTGFFVSNLKVREKES